MQTSGTIAATVGLIFGMGAVGVAIFTMVAALTSIGLAVRQAFGVRRLRLDDILLAFWIGYGATILFLILWNFFLPVGRLTLAVVLIAASVYSLSLGRRLPRMFGETWHPRRWEVLLVVVIALWICNQCLRNVTDWDAGLYHVQSVKWAESFPAVKGIANLHGALAFNDSNFLYIAMLDSGFLEGRAFHIANGVLLSMVVLQAIISGLRWLREGLTDSLRLFEFMLLAVGFHVADAAASYSSTVPATLLVVTASSRLYRISHVLESAATEGEAEYEVFALAIILATAVSTKLTAGVFAVLALPIALTAWWRRKRQSRIPPAKVVVWTTLGIALFASAFLVRGVILSGYPLFPFSFAGFPVDWKAPAEQAAAEMANIAFTERGFSSEWISRGWLGQIFEQEVYAAFVPTCIAAASVCFLWLFRRRHPVAVEGRWWLFAPALISIGAWFLSAPSERYAPAFFWSLAALAVAECHRTTWPSLSRRTRLCVCAIVIAVVFSPPVVEPVLAGLSEPRGLIRTILKENFILPAGGATLSTLAGDVPVTTFKTDSGLIVNTPSKLDPKSMRLWPNACWDAPLPCTPNPAPNLQLREPGNLANGFKVDGDWMMQDWPYYWRAGFLEEWRMRSTPQDSR